MLGVVADKRKKVRLEVELSNDAIKATLRDFIKQAQVSWNSQNVRLTDEGKAETPAEARTRADNYRERRSVDSRLNSRKHQASVLTSLFRT